MFAETLVDQYTAIMQAFIDIGQRLSLAYDPEIMKIARKLCEMDGNDPDLIVMGTGSDLWQAAIGAKRSLLLQAPIQPQWMLYVDDALKFKKIQEEK